MTNRDLLKEAIADAKAVKEVAITNAKAALEEAFTPHLKEMFEKKMTEMEEEDEKEMKTEAEDTEMTNEELEELLKELEEGEDLLNDPKTTSTAHGNIAEEEEESEEKEEEGEEEEGKEGEEEEEEVEIDLEDMSEEDLQKFIEEVVDEMIEAGELEAGHEGMEDEAGMEMEEPEMGAEEEVSAEEEVPMGEAKEDHSEKMKAMESELAEAIQTIEVLKGELHEVNLLNSKLLYTNKIFKAKNLNEAQKVKVLTAFDKAETVKEVKLVFETLNEGLEKGAKKELVRESKGFASKPIGASPKQPVVDVNPVFERMKKLAGL
jgi:hypothetical protein